MKISGYEVHSVLTGSFALDGGAMFGTVPKVLWDKTNPADDKNRIDMEARCLLLISASHKILIDVGLGEKLSEKYGEKFATKFQEMYKLNQKKYSLLKSLKNLNIQPEEITDVILTHLHFDHAGGATIWNNEKNKLVPTFPQARYYIQRKNLETAQAPNVREKASYFKENYEALVQADCLKILDGDKENLLPNISVFVTNGHTAGQQLVRVGKKESSDSLVYCGDIVPTSSHVRAPFVMGYDLNPLLVIEEKSRILEQAAQSKSLLFFEHDPYMDAARISKNGNDYSVSEKVNFHAS